MYLDAGHLPPDLDDEDVKGWQSALLEASAVREANLDNVLDMLGHQLGILSERASPEKVGRYLTEQRVGHEAEELRADVLAELRAGLPWLQRVLKEAEARQP